MLYTEEFARRKDKNNYYIANSQEEVIDYINKCKSKVKTKKKTIE